MGGRQFLDLIFVTQFDIDVNSGMEKPWEEYAKHTADLAEPLVVTRRKWETWGTSVEAERGQDALMALLEGVERPAEAETPG